MTEEDDAVFLLLQTLQKKGHSVDVEVRTCENAENADHADIILFNIEPCGGMKGLFKCLLQKHCPMVMFCISSMAQSVIDAFQAENVRALRLTGEISAIDRQKALRRLYEQHVLANESALV